MFELFKKMMRYCTVGAIALVVDYASYFLFTRLFDLPPYVANVAAYVCGNVVSFIGHRFFTFHSSNNPEVFREYVRFLTVTVFGLAISETVIIYSLNAGIVDFIGKGVAVILSGLFNFYVNSTWTFRPCAKNDKK